MSARPARLAAALAVLAALAAPAAAQEGADPAYSRAERIADRVLALTVRLALAADDRTRPLDVAVSARGGVVDVVGDVAGPDRLALAAVALAVPGVRAVRRLDRPAPPARAAPAGSPARTPAEAPPPPPASTFHVVGPGDTLFALAQRYDTTVDELRRLNGLASSTIVAGRRLRVR